ncbi:PA1571 family protein [Pseudomonas sp. LFM046]|uniref:PA1571 family protein n=1 Tax=Pseudomonas sp. LFM046 TaxID=1608357 RepID=UPI000B153DFA|nr:PA1571 family protein [Pseudomonas sp. LFM046]
MSLHDHTSDRRVIPLQQHRPVGGAIIDAQGREIPITETMIQRACQELHKQLATELKQA